MIYKYDNILSNDKINYILNLSQVINAKNNIDSKNINSIYFTISLPTFIKESIYQSMGLNLLNIKNIPMKWIKGNTPSHIDKGTNSFNNTYLIYLTNNTGDLIIDNNYYPIIKGTGYIFSEGLTHETINTNSEPRLLIGPMNEYGLSVGAISSLSGSGGSSVYIRQLNIDSSIEYSYNSTDWYNINFPCPILNTDTQTGFFKVIFTTDITITNEWQYFICTSEYIQFGSDNINDNGTIPIITIDNVFNYPGLIQNGTDTNYGYNYISIFNLNIHSISSTILNGSGWLCQSYFSRASNNNIIINCTNNGGCLIGSFAGSDPNAQLTVIGCSNTGDIAYYNGGGIISAYAAYNYGNIICNSCFNYGKLLIRSGGIIGANAANTNSSITINNCYNIGLSDESSGGIVGIYAGNTNGYITINNCYSKGNINSINSGGIIGEYAQNVIINNCYTTGNINSSNNAGGICGNNSSNIIITNCYTSGSASVKGYIIGGSTTIPSSCYSEASNNSSGWNTSNANTVLIGTPYPIVGSIWVASIINQPYDLYNIGFTPYITQNITNLNQLNKTKQFTITISGTTTNAIISATYSILQKNIRNLTTDLTNTITINTETGSISTNNTPKGIYTIYILCNNGIFNNISIINLNVGNITPVNYLNLVDTTAETLINTDDKISIYNCINAVIYNNYDMESNNRIDTNTSLSKAFNNKFYNTSNK